MGLFNDKHDLINKLKIAISMSSSIDWEKEAKAMFNGGMDSLNTAKEGAKDDALGFIVDLVVSLIGTSFLNECVDKTFKSLLKPKNGGKSSLEEALQKQLKEIVRSKDKQAKVPTGFYTPDATGGYDIPVQVLDLFDMFKVSPATPEGKILYGDDQASFVNQFMGSVLQTNTAQSISSLPNTTFKFNSATKTVLVKGVYGSSPEPHTINDFFDVIFDDPNFKLIDNKKLMADIVDAILSVLAKQKTKAGLKVEELVGSIVDRVSVDETTSDEAESYYKFSPEWYEQITQQSEEKKKGVYKLHNSCEVTEVEFTIEELEGVVLALQNGGGLESLDVLVSGKVNADGGTFTPAANESMKRGILKAIITAILKNTLLSPRIWLIILLSTAFKRGYSQSELKKFIINTLGEVDVVALINEHKDSITIITKIVKTALLNILINLVIKQIIKMITPWLIERQTEALVQYKNLMLSLKGIK
jgi:hypothetical protein